MSKQKLVIAIISLVLLLGGGYYFFYYYRIAKEIIMREEKTEEKISFSETEKGFIIQTTAYTLELDRQTGNILSLKDKYGKIFLFSNEKKNPVEIQFRDGSYLNNLPLTSYNWNQQKKKLNMIFEDGKSMVEVEIAFQIDTFDISASIISSKDVILSAAFPTILFSVSNLKGVYQQSGYWAKNVGVGAKLGKEWFKEIKKLFLTYPEQISDFVDIETEFGDVAIYGLRPESEFTPSTMSLKGDGQNGFFSHSFNIYLVPKNKWQTPFVRFEINKDVVGAYKNYAAANGITTTLAKKMRQINYPDFKNSVLFYVYDIPFRKLADEIVPKLPKNFLIFYVPWMQGGFDKQYPDFLPPNNLLGGEEDFRYLVKAIHQAGLKFMPYVNATWWSDDPRGSTFEKEAEAPLARDLKGNLIREDYEGSWGWSLTLEHPAARQSRLYTRNALLNDYKADFLYYDQGGSRPWIYNTNPAAKSGITYVQDLIDVLKEDKPIAVEHGYDKVSEAGVLLFNHLTFGLPWKDERLTNDWGQWDFFPFEKWILHDKVASSYRNLEMDNRLDVLSWNVLTGGYLSYDIHKEGVDDSRLQWLKAMGTLADKIISTYIDSPMKSWSKLGSYIYQAEYETNITVTANFDKKPFEAAKNITIAPDGFWARSPRNEVMAGVFNAFEGEIFREPTLIIRKDGVVLVKMATPYVIFLMLK